MVGDTHHAEAVHHVAFFPLLVLHLCNAVQAFVYVLQGFGGCILAAPNDADGASFFVAQKESSVSAAIELVSVFRLIFGWSATLA